jgi:hypothetical protein
MRAGMAHVRIVIPTVIPSLVPGACWMQGSSSEQPQGTRTG